jgi:glycosyltransferase involved in cell wall biosynthesis
MIRVGLVANFYDGWLGGVSYFRNLLTALYGLPDRQIEAVIFTATRMQEKYFDGFPAVEIVRSRLFDRGTLPWLIRKVWNKSCSRDYLLERLLTQQKISVLSHSGWLGKGASIPTIGWIPDLQHVHLPDCFDSYESGLRSRECRMHCRYSSAVIVSSYAAQSDLLQLEPDCRSKSHVVQFVARPVDDKTALPSSEELSAKYRYSGRYFLLPNQFWKHKNHSVVIEALGVLLCKEKHVLVIATGDATDYRNPGHFESLMRRVQELGVGENFRYLGLVPSADLAALMQDAMAIINPSLFEGWSTTVEEAKALGQRLVLSDIPVHREQAPMYATYFPPNDAKALADILWTVWREPAPDVEERRTQARGETGTRRIEFAQRYQDIVLGMVRPQS